MLLAIFCFLMRSLSLDLSTNCFQLSLLSSNLLSLSYNPPCLHILSPSIFFLTLMMWFYLLPPTSVRKQKPLDENSHILVIKITHFPYSSFLLLKQMEEGFLPLSYSTSFDIWYQFHYLLTLGSQLHLFSLSQAFFFHWLLSINFSSFNMLWPTYSVLSINCWNAQVVPIYEKYFLHDCFPSRTFWKSCLYLMSLLLQHPFCY